MKKEEDLLKRALSSGIIDLESVRRHLEMKKREEILAEHESSIWYSEGENYWYCHIPDESKKEGRVKRKRRKREAIEQVVYEYWYAIEQAAEEAEAAAQEAEMQQADESVTVKDLFYEFMEYKKTLVGTGTIKRMKADWDRFYVPCDEFLEKPFRELKRTDIDMFFNKVLDQHKIKRKAFNNMCGILKQMLEYAEEAEYIEKSPYRTKINKKKLVPTKKKNASLEVYRGNEKELLLAEMERRYERDTRNTAPLAVMLDFELGARKGEVLALRKSDIVGRRIHISRQFVEEFDVTDIDNIKSLGFVVVDYTKSDDGDRWLPLTDRAVEIIKRVEAANEESQEAFGDYLFVRDGYVMSPDAIDTQIKRGCEYIGIEVKTMHKIRKTYASVLLHNGVNVSVVRDLLGHADESTTLKHYIYNVENDEGSDETVRNILGGTSEKPVQKNVAVIPDNVTRGDRKIISFPKNKKAETLGKSNVSAS